MPDHAPEPMMNQKTAAYLATFGIEANRMPLDGWDRSGYVFFEGPGPMGSYSQRAHRHWPDGFDYSHPLTLWAEDEPSRRAMGVSV